MQPIIVLRLEAPLMAFGGVRVDEINVTDDFPGQSLLTGLLANALGYCHGDFSKLEELQRSVIQAARLDRCGERLIDYQTADLGQDFMRAGWTTLGREEGRSGGAAKTGTHQRWRHYWADRVVTVALSLVRDASVSADRLRAALKEPERPLFLGRKCCVPSSPVFYDCVTADNVLVALETVPLSPRSDARGTVLARWPESLGDRDNARLLRITDERDWQNQVHVGRRHVYQGPLRMSLAERKKV